MSHLIPLSIDVFFYGISFPLGWFSINQIGVSLAGGYDPNHKPEAIEASEEEEPRVEKITVG